MNDIEKIAIENGLKKVREKLIEETIELLEALEKGDLLHVVEEIADVHIVSQQYLLLTHMTRHNETIYKHKIARTKGVLGIE